MSSSTANNPAHWRDRAKEMRALASQANDELSKKMMLGIAADYDRLAMKAELRPIGGSKP